MLDTTEFGNQLKKSGYDFYSGVPCSFLKYLINYAIDECDYVISANEGDAVATCAGAFLGGRKSVLLIQNSGLTNALSPLTSLNYVFEIPLLGFVSLRGEPGIGDQPQHQLMGKITPSLLELIEVEWEYLSKDPQKAFQQLARADSIIKQNRSFFFIVRKNSFRERKLSGQKIQPVPNRVKIEKSGEDSLPRREWVLKAVSRFKDNKTVLLATTGKTGRELFEIEDSPHNLYMVGSMGCVSSLGLGIALSKPQKKVIVIDGDGSVLMRMGALAANAYYSPPNMLHLLLDNRVHDSTGGQSTLSAQVDFVSTAASVGYVNSIYVHNIDELEERVQKWKQNGGLTFLYLKISPGSREDLGRPTVSPPQVKRRIMKFLGEENA